jgi:hypothetical protein
MDGSTGVSTTGGDTAKVNPKQLAAILAAFIVKRQGFDHQN